MLRNVRAHMTTDVISVQPLTPVSEVVELFRAHRIRHVPVVSDGRLVGLISDRDLAGRALGPMSWLADEEQAQALEQMCAREIMTEGPFSIDPEARLAEAARRMLEGKIGCLPVVHDHRLVGMLTESDIVAAVARTA